MNRAVAIAQVVWHPACGQLVLRFADPATVIATGQLPESESDAAAGWAATGDCDITVTNRRHWEFEPLCETVLHEAGHAAGMDHVDDRPSIMNSRTILTRAETTIRGRKVVTWDGIDHRCLDRGRPYLERHGWFRRLQGVTWG